MKNILIRRGAAMLFVLLFLFTGCASQQPDETKEDTPQVQAITPEIDGTMLKITQEEIDAVDSVLKAWVAAQGAHDEAALTEMNAEELRLPHEEGWVVDPTLTVTHCRIQRWGNIEQGVEADIYYTFETADGGTLYGKEYVFLEKPDDSWQVTVNYLSTSETQFEGDVPAPLPQEDTE